MERFDEGAERGAWWCEVSKEAAPGDRRLESGDLRAQRLDALSSRSRENDEHWDLVVWYNRSCS